MKIVGLKAENVKRIRAVELRPDPEDGLVVVGGRNEQGKSSLLDSILYALRGKRAMPAEPLRRGAKRGSVELALEGPETEEVGRFLITRTFTKGGTQLRVQGLNGQDFGSPQALLDGFLGDLTFDPLAFSRMKPAEQREALLNVAAVPADLDELDEREAEAVEQCQEARAAVKVAQVRVKDLPPAEVVEDGPDAEEVMAELRAAQESRLEAERRAQMAERFLDRYEEAENAAIELRQRLEVAEANKDALADQMKAAREAADEIQPPPTEGLEEKLRQARAREQAAERNRNRGTVLDEAADAKGLLARLESRLDCVRQERREALLAATFPVEGLGVTADGVTFEGFPLEQCADSKRLLACAAVGMALNPTLRVLRIADGSLLDSDHLEELRELAEERDFQLWVERVGTDGATVVIEDGTVADDVCMFCGKAPALPGKDRCSRCQNKTEQLRRERGAEQLRGAGRMTETGVDTPVEEADSRGEHDGEA